jgi:hypothetical protein
MAEGVALEEGAIAMRVPGPRSGNARHNAFGLALGSLLSIRVPCVCNDIKVFPPKYSLCSVGHRLQASIVRRVQHHIVRDDQRMLGIDCALQVYMQVACAGPSP